MEELKQAGKLFAPDTFEPMAGKLKQKTAGVVKALCLHIAHTCNLNCSYCFASQGKYHGERAMMSYEVGKRALDFLMENPGPRRNLEVDFFGGEPLMNFQVVKDLVAYARSIEKEKGKNFRFTLTTNGVLVDDDVIQWANKECSNVVLSLDGRKEIHDRFRVDYAGNGSWEKIVPQVPEVRGSAGRQGLLYAVLKEYRTEQLRQKIRHADIWQDTGFLFTKDDGSPMHPDSITGWLKDFSTRHGLPHINPHAFRHTVASVLLANGTDIVTVSKQLGHASITTTESFYSHIIEENKAKAADCIANVLIRKKACG